MFVVLGTQHKNKKESSILKYNIGTLSLIRETMNLHFICRRKLDNNSYLSDNKMQTTEMLSCREYDMLKESEKSSNDRDYFESRKNYFSSWSAKIWKFYNSRTLPSDLKTLGLTLPPYKLEELDEFERSNTIYLPIQLKYYLTHISRWICKYHGAVFQIYDTKDMNDIYDVEKARKAVDDHGPILKLHFLSENAFSVKETVKLENCAFICCDICDNLVPDCVHCCDLCEHDYCNTCINEHHQKHPAHMVESYERKPFCRGKLCCTPKNIVKAVSPTPGARASSNSSIVSFVATECRSRMDNCSDFFHCWECAAYSCSDCIQHAPHARDCVTKTFIKYHNKTKDDKEDLDESAESEQELLRSRYDWRFSNGMLAIGEYGCGEKDYMLLNGPNKGDMFFLFFIGPTHYRMTSTFFNYLCYSTQMNH